MSTAAPSRSGVSARPRGLKLVVVIGACAATLASPVGARPTGAQVDDESPISLDPIPADEVSGPIPFPDGEYEGTIGLDGTFSVDVEQVRAVWSGTARGPIRFTVVGSRLDGSWSINGRATVELFGTPVSGGAVATWSSTGTVEATGSGPYVMSSAAGQGTSTATASVPGVGEQSRSTNFAVPAATVEWERVIEVCGQISASWDQAIQSGLSQLPGTTGGVRTYVTAFPLGVSALQARIDALLASAAALSSDLDDVDATIAAMHVLMYEAEELLGEIETTDLICDADGRFMRIVTLEIQDVMRTLLVNWAALSRGSFDEVTLLRELMVVAVRAGAIGAGSADPVAAAHLERLAAQVAQSSYEEAIGSDVPISRFDDLAVVGLILGIEYVNPDGSTTGPADLCLALGGCSS